MTKLLPLLLVIVGLGKAAKHHVSILEQRPLYFRPRHVGLCKDTPGDTIAENVTITYKGPKFYVNAACTLLRPLITSERMIVHIRRCNDPAEEVNCEHFQTWRFGKEMCKLIAQKNTIWSPLIESFSPTISSCPVAKGNYRLNNATLDTEMLEHIFKGLPVERYFWRVRSEIYDAKLFACLDYGISVLRGRA